MSVIRLLFVIGHLRYHCLNGVWLGMDLRACTIKAHVEKRLDYVFMFKEDGS